MSKDRFFALWCMIFGTGLAFLVLFFANVGAYAKWKAEYGDASPEVQSWYKQQHNSKGEWCCNESDGHPYLGDYTVNKDGSVTLNLAEGPRTLPAYMVLNGPNPTGHAVWWYLDVGSTHRDYCFAPGSLT